MKYLNIRALVTLTLLILTSSYSAQSNGGFTMHPTLFLLNASKGELSSKTNIIYNAGEAPCPIEVTIYERSINAHGEEIQSDTPSDDFIAFPAQLVLMPGERQIVQLQWVGSKLPEFEKHYTVVAQQVPIKGLQEEQASWKPIGQITTVVKYLGLLVLSQDSFKPDLKTVSFQSTRIKDKPSLEIRLTNAGKALQKVENMHFRVTLKNNITKVITPEYTVNTLNGNSIFAGEDRLIYINWNEKFPMADIKDITPIFQVDN